MKKLIVSRKKAFADALLPYWIIVGFSKIIFMQEHNFDEDLCEMSVEVNSIPRITVEELDRIGIRINNGKTKMISVADDVNHLFISTMGGCLSNEIDVDDCMKNNERRITVIQKTDLKVCLTRLLRVKLVFLFSLVYISKMFLFPFMPMLNAM